MKMSLEGTWSSPFDETKGKNTEVDLLQLPERVNQVSLRGLKMRTVTEENRFPSVLT